MTSGQASPAERHRRVAAVFSDRVAGVAPDGWDAPTPVADWRARDVVRHLVEWARGFLAAGVGLEPPPTTPVDEDPVAAWREHAAWVQGLVDEPGDRVLDNPHVGQVPLDDAIDRFYTSDVLMHTWDLARATGQDDRLDEEECATLLAGMEPLDQQLRDSGQYGPRVPVPDDAPVQDRLLGFIGRDPAWEPARTR